MSRNIGMLKEKTYLFHTIGLDYDMLLELSGYTNNRFGCYYFMHILIIKKGFLYSIKVFLGVYNPILNSIPIGHT